jgi:hypothetical protein
MKLYLVCVGCGEAFDEMATAEQHAKDSYEECERGNSHSVMFNVLPESEAM